VRGSNDPATQSRDIEALRAAQTEAEEAGRGVHTSNDILRRDSIFSFDTDAASSGVEVMAMLGKGVPIAGIVDAVLTGSTLKIVALPHRLVLTFAVAGAQAPNVRRTPDGSFEGEHFGVEVRLHPHATPTSSRLNAAFLSQVS
jgi:hypothetical protein